MEAYVIAVFIKMMETMMGVKDAIIKKLPIKEFVSTLFAITRLDKDTLSFNGELLSEFKLDKRFTALVSPRFVGINDGRYCVDLVDHAALSDPKYAGGILTATGFVEAQEEIIGAMRKVFQSDTNMDAATVPTTINQVIDRVGFNGQCHGSGEGTFMPLPLTIQVCKDVWYNTGYEDAITMLVADVLKSFRA